MTNTQTGRRAETVAAAYLRQHGYQILQENWRTRYCEIDIVAHKQATVHFVEVKYRASANYGHGLEYITAQKVRQMTFAARMWTQQYSWRGMTVLSALEVGGSDFAVTEFIEALV